MMSLYNEKKSNSKGRILVGILVALVFVAGALFTYNYLIQSQSERAKETQSANVTFSCTEDTPIENLPRSMKVGDSGTCVAVFRELLESYYPDNPPLGSGDVFTEDLAELVSRFQADSSITNDSVVGEETWTTLRNALTNRPESSESETPVESDEPSESPEPSETLQPSEPEGWTTAPLPTFESIEPSPSKDGPQPMPQPDSTFKPRMLTPTGFPSDQEPLFVPTEDTGN